jgi:hypothetical protein
MLLNLEMKTKSKSEQPMRSQPPVSIPRRPVISSSPTDWWRICTMPELGELNGAEPQRQHMVDHGFIQDVRGNWQLWACLRGTKISRLIYGWKGESLTCGPWEPTGIKVRASGEWGEQVNRNGMETAGAPFFFRDEGLYYCLYHSGGFRIMNSEDGENFERLRLPDGSNRTGIPGGRDIMLMKKGDLWYAYATVTEPLPGKEPTRENLTSLVLASTSTDMRNWSEGVTVSRGGIAGQGPVDAESPFVVALDGYYYLFRSSSISFDTFVYRSTDPLDFGINDDSKLVATVPIKAPEIVFHEGEWYISDLHDFQGIRMTHFTWEEDHASDSMTTPSS